MHTTKTGTITTVKNRGFGFIRGDDQRDAFFHATALAAGLDFDEQLIERHVEFDVIPTDRGDRAIAIRPAKSPFTGH